MKMELHNGDFRILLHKNVDTSNFPIKIRRQIYAVEKLVRLGERLGVRIYANCFYESDFFEWVVNYDQGIEQLNIVVRCLDSISVPLEYHNITDLTLSQLAVKLSEIELIF